MMPPRVALLLAVICLGGCSQKVALVPVEGTVSIDEKPAGDIHVSFLPDPENGTKGPVSTGITDETGHFTLTTSDQRPGAVPGTHIVHLRDLQSEVTLPKGKGKSKKETAKVPKPSPSRISADYRETSPKKMRKTVSEGDAPIVLKLKSK